MQKIEMVTTEQVEHLASRAAELGDTETEQICDDVLAGITDSSVLRSIVESDDVHEYAAWMERGINMGHRSRVD